MATTAGRAQARRAGIMGHMIVRAASSTAVLVCQGRAIADGRHAVGRFRDPIARQLLGQAERLMVDRG